MEALLVGAVSDLGGMSESVQTMVDRYADVEAFIPAEIDAHALPYFSDRLTEHVHLVVITATAEEDAYTILETMNDRGLSLSPLDMFKGHLLAHITDPAKRNLAAKVWRDRIESRRRLGKEEDSDAIKAWLRARHASTLHERHREDQNKDVELIGTEFHRWVDKNNDALKLKTTDDYFRFTHDEMAFYSLRVTQLTGWAGCTSGW